MARIRTIKPEFFKHLRLFELEEETGLPVRVAFPALWTVSDREGRFVWIPRQLKIDCLPYDEVDFSRVLDALMTRDFVRKYTVNGVDYGYIPGFSDHQVINNRESASKLPDPSQDEGLTRAPRVDDAKATPAQGKGREGKGKEGNNKDILSSKLDDDAKEVFEFWVQTMNKTKSAFSDDRKKKILTRLSEGYTVEEIKRAILNCSNTPHNMGQNENRKVYNDIELICRTPSKLEQFRDNPGSLNAPNQNQTNLDVARRFLETPEQTA